MTDKFELKNGTLKILKENTDENFAQEIKM